MPDFVAEIKAIFTPDQLSDFFDAPRRLGALGHTADDGGHRMLRSQVDDEEIIREDTRNLMLFEWARELLLDED